MPDSVKTYGQAKVMVFYLGVKFFVIISLIGTLILDTIFYVDSTLLSIKWHINLFSINWSKRVTKSVKINAQINAFILQFTVNKALAVGDMFEVIHPKSSRTECSSHFDNRFTFLVSFLNVYSTAGWAKSRQYKKRIKLILINYTNNFNND